MSDKSGIEWTDATWNPVTGCTKVSEGCRNCYALTFAERWRGTPGHYFENGFDITLRPDKLNQPLLWKKPRKIFVNSMSDLFHESVPFEFIFAVWARMIGAPQHIYQILTKRPARMLEFFKWNERQAVRVETYLPNVWIGVSVENQQAADERIPLLLKAPAAVRFLSCEPLLGPVNIAPYLWDIGTWEPYESKSDHKLNGLYSASMEDGIDWIIVGGESGNKARPMHPEWARDLANQCNSAGVAFFFKQWGQHIPYSQIPEGFEMSDEQRAECDTYPHGESFIKGSKKMNGRLLDGREWNEMPVMI